MNAGRLRSLLLALLCVASAMASADQAFYSERVEVPDRTENALVQASRTALERVLIRASGDENIAGLPAIAATVSGARNRMSLYTYEESEDGDVLFVQFDANVVKNILRSAGATFWAEERPPVLLWLVVDEPYARRFATVSEDGELLKSIAGKFADRGVELRLPLLDLQDAAALQPAMVWQKVTPRILAASERYGTEHILVGRYVQLTNGQQIADWLYLAPEDSLNTQLQGREAEPILAGAVDMVVDDMAANLSVVLAPATTLERIGVTVSGVRSYTDYEAVVALFNKISVIEGVQVASVQGDLLELKIAGITSADTLVRLLPKRSRLVIEGPGTGDSLNLRWGQP